MHPVPDRKRLETGYLERLDARQFILKALAAEIESLVQVLPSPPGVKGRVKDFSSFYKKYLKLLKEGAQSKRNDNPAVPISDIIGIRVICPFLEDLPTVEKLLRERYEVFEVERKGNDHSFREFGYESVHVLLRIPERMRRPDADCDAAEVQIRTILQDAWAEVEHELVYKAEFTPFGIPMKRKLAAVNANLSLADIIFQEIRSYQRRLNAELGKRRSSFFRKIENVTDDALTGAGRPPVPAQAAPPPSLEDAFFAGSAEENAAVDDLLLSALSAHNESRFDDAIALYTRILGMQPPGEIAAVIYKHRGMAQFACSRYEEALADFASAIERDSGAYKAAYYQGVVHSVLQKYPEAIAAFSRSLEMQPYQPYCLLRRGQAWYHLEDYPSALADCDAALSLEPLEAARHFKELLVKKVEEV
ncbi:MAG: tetratricopeptide repeat protein [Treponema sp.]|jgi:putative GTP pyrophosphokinase|nr:tetratricopeptide repeat protein [Treponema sp.]